MKLFRTLSLIAALVFLITGTFKIIGAIQPISLWHTTDPVLHINRLWLFLGGGLCEIVVGILLIANSNPFSTWLLQCYPCIIFIGYNYAFNKVHAAGPCPCLGMPEVWWPWLATHSATVKGALNLLLSISVGGTSLILFHDKFLSAKPTIIEKIP
jgi:hypothetical protein